MINIFQSTLPRRERPHGDAFVQEADENFNPHSHEGSDQNPLQDVRSSL